MTADKFMIDSNKFWCWFWKCKLDLKLLDKVVILIDIDDPKFRLFQFLIEFLYVMKALYLLGSSIEFYVCIKSINFVKSCSPHVNCYNVKFIGQSSDSK